jgi:hypothetical protein
MGDQMAEFLGRLCLSAPLLYFGLRMAIDPASVVSVVEMVACGIRNFQRDLSGLQWQEPSLRPTPENIPARLRLGVKLFGLGLAGCAFVFLSGLP